MAKVNTLFSYFSKKTPSKTSDQNEIKGSEILSTHKNGNKSGLGTPKIGKGKDMKDKNTKEDTKACPFEPYDLVWAKLEGFPWWPSMVTNHPKSKCHFEMKDKRMIIHVQFFDDPPTRGWVKEKYTRAFTGSDSRHFERGGIFFSLDPQCRVGALEADKAMKLDKDERSSLVVAMETSSEEEEEEEEEEMDVGEEVGGLDSSKENAGTPEKSSSDKNKNIRSSARAKPTKRRRVVIAADSEQDSGDEYKVAPADKESGSSASGSSSGVDEDDASSTASESDPESPVKKRKRGANETKAANQINRKTSESLISSFATPVADKSASNSKVFSPVVSDKTKSKLALFSAPDESPAAGTSGESRTFPHLSIDFIKPDKIKDGDGRKRDHPEYDSRTLHVPDTFLQKQTPGMKQWWALKAKHYDTVLFFKMGKFYELFHMDAVIAVNETGLIYMRGDHAHAGFPEISYGRYAESLIQKGYKVARIEQTETPDMAADRCKQLAKTTKFDKVVRREVCSVQTKGTKRYSFIDGDSADSSNAYLLAICEQVDTEAGSGQTYGVCFIDTSIGKFYIGQFEDDRHSSRLRTLISHYPPAQVLTERCKLSDKTQSLLNNNLPSILRDTLRSGTEFWDSSKTLKTLSEGGYFTKQGEDGGTMEWPQALKEMISEDDALGHSAASGYEMGVSALGAVIWYLRYSLMDEELLSMRDFAHYVPVDVDQTAAETTEAIPQFITQRHKMVLDGVTLANLDILMNGNTGTSEGTLLERIDNCTTPFGKRLLKQWLCTPLCNPDAINDRLDAIEDLMEVPDISAEVTQLMKKMPDLERLLSKIHTLGSAVRSSSHPDGRAIFFEAVTYSKRKIEDFLSALTGFETSIKLIEKFAGKSEGFKSRLLRRSVQVSSEGQEYGKFPCLEDELAFFAKAFDHQKARSEGVIKPSRGVDKDYDNAIEDLKTINDELHDYLDRQKKRIGCRTIVYFGTAKNRFQMEVPDSVRHVPDEYEVTSSRKGFKRYTTPDIKELFSRLTDTEDRRDAALKDIMRRIFHTFDNSYDKWSAAVQCLSVLDVLISLSQYSRCGDGVMCRPQLVLPSAGIEPQIEIREGRHPCISRTFAGGDFIPNDTVIGTKDDQESEAGSGDDHSSVVLVTGPNMGGKSTLMRQVGIITVMAQLGCYVPAEKCVLTPVDRVFTRLGATDRIMAGESTFFVELSETSSILQHATRHSLVLLDELGRGTATYDGTAIACAVVNELSQNIRCRTLFSTHYHSLVDEFSHDPNVRLGHMACMVENENEEDPTQETITFLYKFIKGACPKSYGFNAARLASIPDDVICVAHKKAKEFQQSMDKIRYFRSICQSESLSVKELCDLQDAVSS